MVMCDCSVRDGDGQVSVLICLVTDVSDRCAYTSVNGCEFQILRYLCVCAKMYVLGWM